MDTTYSGTYPPVGWIQLHCLYLLPLVPFLGDPERSMEWDHLQQQVGSSWGSGSCCRRMVQRSRTVPAMGECPLLCVLPLKSLKDLIFKGEYKARNESLSYGAENKICLKSQSDLY